MILSKTRVDGVFFQFFLFCFVFRSLGSAQETSVIGKMEFIRRADTEFPLFSLRRTLDELG